MPQFITNLLESIQHSEQWLQKLSYEWIHQKFVDQMHKFVANSSQRKWKDYAWKPLCCYWQRNFLNLWKVPKVPQFAMGRKHGPQRVNIALNQSSPRADTFQGNCCSFALDHSVHTPTRVYERKRKPDPIEPVSSYLMHTHTMSKFDQFPWIMLTIVCLETC